MRDSLHDESESLNKTTLSLLMERCSHETARFYRGEEYSDRFCYELVRRAICLQDQSAWDFIVRQYRPQILSWIANNQHYERSWGIDEDLIQESLLRFSRAVTPDRFVHFTTLAHLLQYLYACVQSSVSDEVRRRSRARLGPVTQELADESQNILPRILSDESRLELWSRLKTRITDEREALLFDQAFIRNRKPREIHSLFPQTFASITQIYRIKRTLIERLQRDPSIQRIWQEWQA